MRSTLAARASDRLVTSGSARASAFATTRHASSRAASRNERSPRRLRAAGLTAIEAGLVGQAVRNAFGAWQNGTLHFDITLDSAVAQEGASVGAELDLFSVPGDHPVFLGTTFFGITFVDYEFVSERLLTNGTRVDGWMITGVDIYLNATRLQQVRQEFGIPLPVALRGLTRLLMHEIGHGIGLHHPNQLRNFDTNLDPLDQVAVDPLDPFAGVIESPNFDMGAIMSNEPCGPGVTVCAAVFFQELQPDDRHGRDVLYPTPEPATALLVGLGLAALAMARRWICLPS